MTQRGFSGPTRLPTQANTNGTIRILLLPFASTSVEQVLGIVKV